MTPTVGSAIHRELKVNASSFSHSPPNPPHAMPIRPQPALKRMERDSIQPRASEVHLTEEALSVFFCVGWFAQGDAPAKSLNGENRASLLKKAPKQIGDWNSFPRPPRHRKALPLGSGSEDKRLREWRRQAKPATRNLRLHTLGYRTTNFLNTTT